MRRQKDSPKRLTNAWVLWSSQPASGGSVLCAVPEGPRDGCASRLKWQADQRREHDGQPSGDEGCCASSPRQNLLEPPDPKLSEGRAPSVAILVENRKPIAWPGVPRWPDGAKPSRSDARRAPQPA